MTPTAPEALRVISFGDLEGRVWGTAIDAGVPAIVFATPDGSESASGADAVRLTSEGETWRLAGDGFELLISPAAPPPVGSAGDQSSPTTVSSASQQSSPTAAFAGDRGLTAGGEELCHVTGTLRVGDIEHAVECLGTRSVDVPIDFPRLESIRGLSGWFASDRALSLLSLRPVRGSGQETDRVAATLFEPSGWVTVDDPRLSTTFRSGERPSRASLELWIGDGEEQYPRRAAAEALGDGAEVVGAGVTLQVTPLRCHIGGVDGSGVYLLARF